MDDSVRSFEPRRADARLTLHLPAANLNQVLSLILIGPILVPDSRLLGIGRGIAIPVAAPLLSRLSAGGLVLMLMSGFSLLPLTRGLSPLTT